jgi:hypothetical protein
MLKSKIPDGKKAVANKGYRGDPKKLATQNTFDSAELKTFKRGSRLTMRPWLQFYLALIHPKVGPLFLLCHTPKSREQMEATLHDRNREAVR